MTVEDPIIVAACEALAGLTLPDGTPLLGSPKVTGPMKAGSRLNVIIAIEPGEADAVQPLRAEIEARLGRVAGGDGAMVILTAERPASTATAAPKTGKAAVLPGVRHVIAVASGKGGVGKSTTTVNLALGLRLLGLKVGILDADVHGPSLPTLLGLHGQPTMGEGRKLRPMEAHGVKAMSMGLLVDAETAMVWRGPMVMSALTQMIAEVDWGVLDVLLIDMPPGTGDAQLAIAQGTPLAGAVIVSTPQDLALIDARRGISMFRKVDVPIIGIIENMAHFICPDCGSQHAIFGEGGARDEARRLGVAYLGAVPLTMALRAASDTGRPLTASDPEGTIGTIYTAMAKAVRDHLAAARAVAV